MKPEKSNQDPMPEYLTTRQAAAVLGYSPEYVQVLCRHGQILAERRGRRGHYRIERKTLQDLMGKVAT